MRPPLKPSLIPFLKPSRSNLIPNHLKPPFIPSNHINREPNRSKILYNPSNQITINSHKSSPNGKHTFTTASTPSHTINPPKSQLAPQQIEVFEPLIPPSLKGESPAHFPPPTFKPLRPSFTTINVPNSGASTPSKPTIKPQQHRKATNKPPLQARPHLSSYQKISTQDCMIPQSIKLKD
ncbi:36.4 kDa proline-rich protein-like [Cornus florida]|uniref:36.4 kDa proline-rich protein-like n=1 Tax=Cornus florida TaxID=4283 RepID=UPI0028968F61|nr:36.4 kDa proline-rich protein-like [Cornus florida]